MFKITEKQLKYFFFVVILLLAYYTVSTEFDTIDDKINHSVKKILIEKEDKGSARYYVQYLFGVK